MTVSQDTVRRYLRRDPLKHILHLKMLTYHEHLIKRRHVVQGADEGILLLFPTTALSYDHKKYGAYELVAMPVADSSKVLDELLAHVPPTDVVFKLVAAEDEALLKRRFVGSRVRAFLNFTSPEAIKFQPDPSVVVSTQLNEKLVEAFGKNGHTPTELVRFFADGGQALSVEEEGQPVSVGMIYRNFENIWEVAALFTEPAARRKGYSARIVRTALHLLQTYGYTPRYVVDATNIASIKLAQKVGLDCFLTVIHYTAKPKSSTGRKM